MRRRPTRILFVAHVACVAALLAARAPRRARADVPRDVLSLPPSELVQRVDHRAVYTADGFTVVDLDGGEPRWFPLGGPSSEPVRIVSGRVVDRDGAPVANAIVFAGHDLDIQHGTMIAAAGSVTDARGAFTLRGVPRRTAVVLAVAGDDWTRIAQVDAGGQLSLVLGGHASLAAQITYGGKPELVDVQLASSDGSLVVRSTSGADGRLVLPSLPPDTYTVTIERARKPGSARPLYSRQLTLAAGKTTTLALDLARGTSVELLARVARGAPPRSVRYWLFEGTAPRDGVEAHERARHDAPPSLAVGGGAASAAVELEVAGPGTYWACAAVFDTTSLSPLAKPFGCAPVIVPEGGVVPRTEIRLAE